MLIRFLSCPGRPFWKVDGILSGLGLEVQDYLLLEFYSSEYLFIDQLLMCFQPFSFLPFSLGLAALGCDGKNLKFFHLKVGQILWWLIALAWFLHCCRRFPSTLANLSKMDVAIKDGYAKITANLKLLNSVRKFAQIYYSCKEVSFSFNMKKKTFCF